MDIRLQEAVIVEMHHLDIGRLARMQHFTDPQYVVFIARPDTQFLAKRGALLERGGPR